MTCSIQQVLADAKRLVTQLREHEGNADTLINQARKLNGRVDSMRIYQEDAEEAAEVARKPPPPPPRSTLVFGLQQENRHIRDLQHENRELQLALDDHQAALELIMSKYRRQISQLMVPRATAAEATPADDAAAEVREEIERKNERICEMVAVMNAAIRADDAATPGEIEAVARLRTENRGLREMLRACSTLSVLASASADDDPQAADADVSACSDDSNANTVMSRSVIEVDTSATVAGGDSTEDDAPREST
ncbi:PREDICTED: FGFR1 oncogene partner 2 homolog [Priapulus caudatus]|uniref:FGFR1 oncogene partner 2 homolog n=1 Tax=Priapulus caudatus TaxID=37621 RepID=A0ABM1E3R4_PRICU|nr:PREDICTED: FGFR1 oncogene partner 2 homolog [Priapulus caudatus]XP_014666834.1 PREDICTED: FGFR1 oncogene partner 2 homolog [Priapulus caudatus]XP_014666835.1 PREDICTED: FGFR1 oncogene partner 2 homolog [Priapulus caudatus]XP_014666836.1 PREDICTED: FGFR1 oncogene partner 2 homolog [Priapulus caudatus]XP_014666837.1 PREDICTED: FGFR1 oncogene partner 2 homolog [Priapulus caudatus]